MDAINKINVNGVDYLLVPSKETIQQKDINPTITPYIEEDYKEYEIEFNDIDYSNKHINVILEEYITENMENGTFGFTFEAIKNSTFIIRFPFYNTATTFKCGFAFNNAQSLVCLENKLAKLNSYETDGYETHYGNNNKYFSFIVNCDDTVYGTCAKIVIDNESNVEFTFIEEYES
jgi:hypothetical protein